jgi:hypothetical protein
MRKLLLALLLAGGIWHYWPMGAPPSAPAPPPVTLAVPEPSAAPVQRDLRDGPVFEIAGVPAHALAEYALAGRVLSTRRYRLGDQAALAPLDLALGWGRMADPAVVRRLAIAQRHRWYLWRYEGSPPLPVREIATSSANLHLVPADSDVARALRRLDAGDTVALRGYLLELRRADGWVWRSSLSREDTGAGACELLYVQSAMRTG